MLKKRPQYDTVFTKCLLQHLGWEKQSVYCVCLSKNCGHELTHSHLHTVSPHWDETMCNIQRNLDPSHLYDVLLTMIYAFSTWCKMTFFSNKKEVTHWWCKNTVMTFISPFAPFKVHHCDDIPGVCLFLPEFRELRCCVLTTWTVTVRSCSESRTPMKRWRLRAKLMPVALLCLPNGNPWDRI